MYYEYYCIPKLYIETILNEKNMNTYLLPPEETYGDLNAFRYNFF